MEPKIHFPQTVWKFIKISTKDISVKAPKIMRKPRIFNNPMRKNLNLKKKKIFWEEELHQKFSKKLNKFRDANQSMYRTVNTRKKGAVRCPLLPIVVTRCLEHWFCQSSKKKKIKMAPNFNQDGLELPVENSNTLSLASYSKFYFQASSSCINTISANKALPKPETKKKKKNWWFGFSRLIVNPCK